MKIRELLANLKYENPESEVVPISDENGRIALTVMLPDRPPQDVSMLGSEEARKLLGEHLGRIEKIRVAVGAFYGLPVVFACRSYPGGGDSVELKVKSPTGQTMVSLEIAVGYVLIKDGYDWRQETSEQHWGPNGEERISRKFAELPADLVGYRMNIHKYVLTNAKLATAMSELCEAPKWLEYVAERS